MSYRIIEANVNLFCLITRGFLLKKRIFFSDNLDVIVVNGKRIINT